MWKKKRFLVLIWALCLSPVLHAEEVEVSECDEGMAFVYRSSWFGGSKACLSSNGSTVLQLREGGSATFASGAAATALAEAHTRSLKVIPPTPPQMSEMKDASGSVMGGFSELLPGTGILVTDRHVLQAQPEAVVAGGLKAAGGDLANYGFYEIRRSGTDTPYDVILAIPHGKESEILEDAQSNSACPCDGSRPMVLKTLDALKKQVGSDDLYYSYQFGTVGSKKTDQKASGTVSRTSGIPVERFFLDLDSQNHSTARSSGALVYLAPASAPQGIIVNPEWKVGGVIECQIEPHKSRSGVFIPGGVQVIPFSTLIDRGEVRQIPLGNILREKRKQDPDCPPIDGRDGGG